MFAGGDGFSKTQSYRAEKLMKLNGDASFNAAQRLPTVLRYTVDLELDVCSS